MNWNSESNVIKAIHFHREHNCKKHKTDLCTPTARFLPSSNLNWKQANCYWRLDNHPPSESLHFGSENINLFILFHCVAVIVLRQRYDSNASLIIVGVKMFQDFLMQKLEIRRVGHLNVPNGTETEWMTRCLSVTSTQILIIWLRVTRNRNRMHNEMEFNWKCLKNFC